jgi:hypothetical protein
MTFKTKSVSEFITKDTSKLIIDFAESSGIWEDSSGEFWSKRIINAVSVYNQNKEIGTILYNIRKDIKNFIEYEMTNGEEVFPDLLQIVRWFPGQSQQPHWDDMKGTIENEWFNHRDFGSIIYLNDNFLGGETYYPKYNQVIKPKTGTLAVHPGDQDHLHGVTKVSDSIRYTLAAFWTYEKEYFDGWTIH